MNVGFQWQKTCCCCYRLGDPTAIQIRDGGAKDRFGRQTTNTTIRNCLHHGKKEKAPELTTFDDGSSGDSVFHSLDSIRKASLILFFLVEGGYMAVKRHDCSNHQHVEREHDHSNSFPLLIDVFKLVWVALLVLHGG